MDLYKEILAEILSKRKISVSFADLEINAVQIVELESYKALMKIRDILRDDNLEDKECFIKIEEIVKTFEALGSDCGIRHDFG